MLASILCEKGDLEANLGAHLDALARARVAGCDVAVFPEFSLTGSVDARRYPERAVTVEDDSVRRLVAATSPSETGVDTVFGIGERCGDARFITQVVAQSGRLVGVQRKRRLGEGEEGHRLGVESPVFEIAGRPVGLVICAEARVERTWDATVAAGADVVFFCSAPGLWGRRTDEASWRAGSDWWEECGLGDARRHAARLQVWVAMATQAGSTADEDFPGNAALISPLGEILHRLPDWRAGELVVDIPGPAPDATERGIARHPS